MTHDQTRASGPQMVGSNPDSWSVQVPVSGRLKTLLLDEWIVS